MLVALIVSLAGALGGCGGSGPTASPPVARITATAPSPRVPVGGTVSLTVLVADASGQPLTQWPVAYTSATPDHATVDARGVVTGVAPGAARLIVAAGGQRQDVALEVVATLGRVAVWPQALLTAPGRAGRLSTTVFDADSSVLGGGAVTFASSDPAVLSVDAVRGTIEARQVGTAVITATDRRPDGVRIGTTSVTVAAPPISQYSLRVEFLGTVPPQFAAVTQAAVARWERIIAGDLADVRVAFQPGDCGVPTARTLTVDDLVLFVSFPAIDGPGKTLGRAGICGMRAAGVPLPFAGLIALDSADIAQLLVAGTAVDVVTHEIGHALGFGVGPWDATAARPALRVDVGTDVTRFIGAQAQQASAALGFFGGPLLLENTGGPGTQDAHWRKLVFGAELMTGFLTTTGAPLSAITVGAMGDIGYEVVPSAAEITTAQQLAVDARLLASIRGSGSGDFGVGALGVGSVDAGVTRPVVMPRSRHQLVPAR